MLYRVKAPKIQALNCSARSVACADLLGFADEKKRHRLASETAFRRKQVCGNFITSRAAVYQGLEHPNETASGRDVRADDEQKKSVEGLRCISRHYQDRIC